MSLHLEFTPHSWYMGFAIKKDNDHMTHSWGAYIDDGMSGYIIEIEAMHLNTLKRHIRQYHLKRHTGYGERIAKRRLAYLRQELRAERMSYEELAELQTLAEYKYIHKDDVELLEAAGVPEKVK